MLNQCVLVGRLTRAPEMRFTPSGIAVSKFTLAVDRSFANADGEREADFIDIVAWRKLAETCSQHLDKGRMVAVTGRLQIRSYEDAQGTRRKAAEIVADNVRFLDSPKKAAPGEAAPGEGETPQTADEIPEEVPF